MTASKDGLEDPPLDPDVTEGPTPKLPFSPNLDEAYKLVPGVGEAWRWYDIPYRFLIRAARSRIGRKLPRKIREQLGFAAHFFSLFNDYQRAKTWNRSDPSHNLLVPPSEAVCVPSIWVAECFPPSESHYLAAATAKNDWDRPRRRYGIREANRSMLDQSRRGSGWIWFGLGTIANETSASIEPDAQRMPLPREFDKIDLVAFQASRSMTIVTATFHLSREGQFSVDRIWHAEHKPRFKWRRRAMPEVQSRLWHGLDQTQSSRRRLHDLAREWMASNCAGAFAHTQTSQPLLDLLLVEKLDPANRALTREHHDALRALGIIHSPYEVTSSQLPGLFLEATREDLVPALKGKNVRTLWGQRDQVRSGMGKVLYAYGGQWDELAAIAGFCDDSVRAYLASLAISDYLQMKHEQQASLRDSARKGQGKYRRKDLEKLRSTFLATSLDASSIARDLTENGESILDREAAIFVRRLAPDLVALEQKDGLPPTEPINVNEELKRQQVASAREIAAADADYRNILATVSALGSSIDAFKLQRYAVYVALVSLFVAVVTLVVTMLGQQTTNKLWDLVQSWWALL
ncbi:hypothetical protein ABZS66_35720 [Dactylosporangium sp. NPDC005572]|uniref:hypothetical protein n=1 Tax=Dactylosporangium sp. NPDC005572 TaxID=3156889 RepID=UPI0033B139AF